jgi:hypothetical protein
MGEYGYEKNDAGEAGQFVVTITTPDGVLGGVLFTRTETAAAAIAGILNYDRDRRSVLETGMTPNRELASSTDLAARMLREDSGRDADSVTQELLRLFGRVFVAGMESVTGQPED